MILHSRLLRIFRFCSKKNRLEQQSSVAKKIQDKLKQFNERSKAQTQIVPKKKQKDEQSTGELRDMILYEDILRNQKRILIYETNGVEFRQASLYLIGVVTGSVLAYYLLQKIKQESLNLKVEIDYTSEGKFLKVCLGSLMLFVIYMTFIKYKRLQNNVVERIIYDTETFEFQFLRRKFLGGSYKQYIPKDKLMYTENQKLWNKGVNYYHLDTMEQFAISLEKGWIKGKEGLFSHLISQRIRLQMKKDAKK